MRFEEGLPIALGELAKSFVNMIGSRPIVGGAAYGQAAVPEQTNNSKILTQSDIDARGENKRKELENLPPYKLAAAVLDKERIERINANGKIKIAV